MYHIVGSWQYQCFVGVPALYEHMQEEEDDEDWEDDDDTELMLLSFLHGVLGQFQQVPMLSGKLWQIDHFQVNSLGQKYCHTL